MTSDGLPLLAATIPLAGVIGLFVGSFLNVVIYRTPLGLSIAAPRSFCPTCQRQLKWWENVPVASWVALRGRCRTCHQPISVRYPLIELSTGITFALVTWAWHGTIIAAAYCILAATMIAVALIEYGGIRAPLSVAAVGTGGAQLVILAGAGWQGHWRIVIGSLIGSVVGLLAFALLRTMDPVCADAPGHGRSALLIAGCWVGGLGWISAAVGASVWIAVYFACMLCTWLVVRRRSAAASIPRLERHAHPLLTTPLVSAIAVALAASLIAGG